MTTMTTTMVWVNANDDDNGEDRDDDGVYSVSGLRNVFPVRFSSWLTNEKNLDEL
jgi:hypothetical protein